MNCKEAQSLLSAYLDSELDLVHSLDIERHLKTCSACDRCYQNLKTLRAGLQSEALSYQPSPAFQKRLQASLRAAARTETTPRVPAWRWVAASAAAAVLLFLAWHMGRITLTTATGNDLVNEVVSDHVRSLMVNHLADVPSTDRHTVKPWFNGKLDYTPPVEDLAAQGFPLTGGRLDYLNGRPVAALIYHRQKHPINLFVWPASQPTDTGLETATRNGYHLIHWVRGGMNYWAISDLNAAELQEFAQDLRK